VCVYHPAELEEMTKTTRLLLPFTFEGEMDTIEAAMLLVAIHHAALVLLSDSYASDEWKGVRLEHIQQSKGFLEVVQQKALRHHAPLERFEVFTGARVPGLFVLVDQLGCDRIQLVLRGRNGSVLDAEMMEQRMAMRFCPLYLISPRTGTLLDIAGARAHLPLATGASAAQTSTCQGSQRSKSRWAGKRP
jgi:hypothetical protein